MAYRTSRQRYESSESESSSDYDDDRSVASSNRSRQSGRPNNSRGEVWCCRECNREFPTRQGLNCHITTMHERARPSREAPELEAFGQLSIRRSSDRVQCPRCDKDYANQGNLNRHMREYHGVNAGASPSVSVRSQTNIQNNVRIQNNFFYYKKN